MVARISHSPCNIVHGMGIGKYCCRNISWNIYVAVLGRNYSVSYFDHVTTLKEQQRKTFVKGRAHKHCVNVGSIHVFTQCI